MAICGWRSCCSFKMLFILFLDRGEGRKKGRETSMCGCLSSAPYWGPGPQPRHVPWLEIEPVTFWLAGQCSIHWATPARAGWRSFKWLFSCFKHSCIFPVGLHNFCNFFFLFNKRKKKKKQASQHGISLTSLSLVILIFLYQEAFHNSSILPWWCST